MTRRQPPERFELNETKQASLFAYTNDCGLKTGNGCIPRECRSKTTQLYRLHAGQARDNDRRSGLHKSRYGVLQNGVPNDMGRLSKVDRLLRRRWV